MCALWIHYNQVGNTIERQKNPGLYLNFLTLYPDFIILALLQEEIRHEVKNVCTIMPKTVKQTCNKFMDEYTDMIIDLIETVPPKSICQQLMVCFMGLDQLVNGI